MAFACFLRRERYAMHWNGERLHSDLCVTFCCVAIAVKNQNKNIKHSDSKRNAHHFTVLNSKWFDIFHCLHVSFSFSLCFFFFIFISISVFACNALKIISTPRVRHFVGHVTINLAIIRVVNAETKFAWVDGKALIAKKVGKRTSQRSKWETRKKRKHQINNWKYEKSTGAKWSEINSSHLLII